MAQAGRVGDEAYCPVDAHGCTACPHSVRGPAVGGSPNVFINGRPALRVGDPGIHSACCGANQWKASTGSSTVFINGLPAHRMGDVTQHCGGMGKLVQGSPNVYIGDSGGGKGPTQASQPCKKEIKEAYFAKKVKKDIPAGTKSYTFQHNNHVSNANRKRIAKIIKKRIEDSTQFTTVEAVLSVLENNKLYKAGDKISVPVFKKKEELEKLTEAHLCDRVYLIAKTECYKPGEKVTFSIYEKESVLVDSGKPVPFLENKQQKTRVIGTVTKDPDTGELRAITSQIELRTKADEKKDDKSHQGSLEDWKEKLQNSKDKKDYLWLKVTGNGEIKEFLKDGWFELYPGCCGKQYRDKIKCTRYGRIYGPIYWGTIPLKDYDGWDNLVNDGKITEDEKEILIGMSANEGKLDTVHSYDSEVLTVGAMQKTINSKGRGEFPIQVEKFKENYPKKYQMLFKDCGWTVENHTMYYQPPGSTERITGNRLKRLIRAHCSRATFRQRVQSQPLEPIIEAAKDKDFQTQQIMDFIDRLHTVLRITPYPKHTIGDYLKSKLGRATALDQHVNRPGYVKSDFKNAVKTMVSRHPEISRDPSKWGKNHAKYEQILLDIYGPSRRGTDMKNRYLKLKRYFNAH